MKYKTGRAGRIVVARFDDQEDILGGLTKIAQDENIRAGIFYLIGGMRHGKIVVGPETETLPPKPIWKEIKESHEILGIGTIFWHEDRPKIHFHGAFGKRDEVKIGCLREEAETFLVIEAVIIEIEGIDAVRITDPASGLALLNL